MGAVDTGGTVLITGGSGFIGQHLVRALAARHRRIRILDVRPPKAARPEVDYVVGSACDPRTVDQALEGIEQVYHLAGMPGMWRRESQDFDTTNHLATAVTLSAARKRGVARFLHCSTESVLFGQTPTPNPISEETKTTMAEMPGVYTRSKKAAEQLALQAAREGVPVVIANPTMPIGSHDYELTPPTAMIHYFLCRRLRLYVNAVMNIADVRDIAAGLILVMERGEIGQRYILGGENASLRQLLELIAGITGRVSLRVCIPMRFASAAAAIMEFIADRGWQPPAATVEGVEIARRSRPLSSEKARHELGYTTRPLPDALSDTIHWLQTDRKNF